MDDSVKPEPETPLTMVGKRVRFRVWTRPYELVTGVIVEEEDSAAYGKQKRYTIQPDKPIGEWTGTVHRWHPKDKMVADKDGKLTIAMPDPQVEDVFEFDVHDTIF